MGEIAGTPLGTTLGPAGARTTRGLAVRADSAVIRPDACYNRFCVPAESARGRRLLKGGRMPIGEILLALWVAALAADSVTVIEALARMALAARRGWQEHKRE